MQQEYTLIYKGSVYGIRKGDTPSQRIKIENFNINAERFSSGVQFFLAIASDPNLA